MGGKGNCKEKEYAGGGSWNGHFQQNFERGSAGLA